MFLALHVMMAEDFKMKCFISGHLDVTESEFNEHYIPLIDKALADGCSFVIGDARGADRMAQQYLNGKTKDVVIFHMFELPRYNEGSWNTKGGYQTDNDRDSAMTKASDFDLAWVREGKEKSGTAKNVNRRILHKHLEKMEL